MQARGSLKLLDIEEGPDGKFLSSGRMMLGQLSIWRECHVVRTAARDPISRLVDYAKFSRKI
jgi:hypothetical protein